MKEDWSKPLVGILNGYDKLAELVRESVGPGGEVVPSTETTVACVYVVIIILMLPTVAAVDDAVLKRGLLDVYGPEERKALQDAVAAVKNDPKLIDRTLGVSPTALIRDFEGSMARVERVLQEPC